MDVHFTPRGDGWRGRGRRPTVVPEQIRQVFQRTLDTGESAELPTDGATRAEIRRTVDQLRSYAEKCGWRLRANKDHLVIRFYVEEK